MHLFSRSYFVRKGRAGSQSLVLNNKSLSACKEERNQRENKSILRLQPKNNYNNELGLGHHLCLLRYMDEIAVKLDGVVPGKSMRPLFYLSLTALHC